MVGGLYTQAAYAKFILICFSGKRIVTADAEGTLIFWDPRSPTPVFKLTPEDARFNLQGITSLSVNASSTLAVVGGVDGGVRVVNLSRGDVIGALEGHREGDSVEAVQFVDLSGAGAGSGVVVTGGTDGKACIWDLSTMRLRANMEHEVSLFPQESEWVTETGDTGCDNFADRPPLAKEPSYHISFCGQDAEDMGCADGESRQGV